MTLILILINAICLIVLFALFDGFLFWCIVTLGAWADRGEP